MQFCKRKIEESIEGENLKQAESFSFKQLLIYPVCTPKCVPSFLSFFPFFSPYLCPILCLRSFYSQANHMMMWICTVNAAAETDCRSVAIKTSYEYTMSLRNITTGMLLWTHPHIVAHTYEAATPLFYFKSFYRRIFGSTFAQKHGVIHCIILFQR